MQNQMSDKNIKKVERIELILMEKDLFFESYPNGQISVDGVNFWCTSEKWYNPRTGKRGLGINSFLKEVE